MIWHKKSYLEQFLALVHEKEVSLFHSESNRFNTFTSITPPKGASILLMVEGYPSGEGEFFRIKIFFQRQKNKQIKSI